MAYADAGKRGLEAKGGGTGAKDDMGGGCGFGGGTQYR